MVILVTVSGLSQSAENFRNQVENALSGHYTEIYSLNWQQNFISQSAADLFDIRSTEDIIIDVTSQLLEIIEKASQKWEKLVIISYSSGSMITELALSIIANHPFNPYLIHLMLAPNITGSDWAAWGQLVSGIIAGAISKLVYDRIESSFWKVITVITAMIGISKLLGSDRFLADLGNALEETILEIANIKRYVIYGSQDTVSRLPPLNILKALYYKGDYTHSEVGSLTSEGLRQEYNRLDLNTIFTKLNILYDALYS